MSLKKAHKKWVKGGTPHGNMDKWLLGAAWHSARGECDRGGRTYFPRRKTPQPRSPAEGLHHAQKPAWAPQPPRRPRSGVRGFTGWKQRHAVFTVSPKSPNPQWMSLLLMIDTGTLNKWKKFRALHPCPSVRRPDGVYKTPPPSVDFWGIRTLLRASPCRELSLGICLFVLRPQGRDKGLWTRAQTHSNNYHLWGVYPVPSTVLSTPQGPLI